MKGRLYEDNTKGWFYYVNWFHERSFRSRLESLSPRFRPSNYKLHIALPIEHFDEYQYKLFDLLKRAVDEGVLYEAKMLNKGGTECLQQQISSHYGLRLENSTRIYNNPFTLYLYEHVQVERVVKLCREIEDILINTPALNRDHLSKADLSLTQHISFRLDTLDGQYVGITKASHDDLESLEICGKRSDEYIALTAALAKPKQSSTSSNALLTSSGMYVMGAAFVMGVAIGLALGLTPNTDLAVWAISLISLTPALATSVGTCLHWAKPEIGRSAANTLNEGCSSLWYNLKNFHLR